MSTDIVVVGSLNHDITLLTTHHPGPGETVLGTGHYSDNGGKGANQAIAAARLGASVAMVGLVGHDGHGASLTSALKNEGIDITGVGIDPETPTGLAVITVDAEAENTIVVSPGANARIGPDHIDRHRTLLADARMVLAQLEIPVATVAAAAAAAKGMFCLNPAPATDLPPELRSRVDVLIPNRSELASLAGVQEPSSITEVVDAVERVDIAAIVIVTLGADGALVVEGKKTTHVEAPEVRSVDPTGAGDAFCGALADGISRGLWVGEATRRAVVAGALATTRPGAQAGLPTADELDDALSRLG
ncbi:MAG TPA: ribokinase [Acidimicrobiia bacterium]|nr:ribokinase [Acidimicrobiia bacterium]